MRPGPPQDLEAVDLGQHQIEHDQVGRRGQRPDRRLAVADRGDPEALALEIAGDDLAHHLLVVDYEDVGGRGHRGLLELAAPSLRLGYGPLVAPAQAPPSVGFPPGVPAQGQHPDQPFPWVTVALIAVNLVVFGCQLLQPTDQASTLQLARERSLRARPGLARVRRDPVPDHPPGQRLRRRPSGPATRR